MGIGPAQMILLQDSLQLTTELVFPELQMLEFGNQYAFRLAGREQVPAKLVFQWLGVKHTSIDINGKDGALKLDLGQPLPAEFTGFDVVTNFGCIEHIKGHYQAWKNIHDACRIDGIMVHALPDEGSWPGHGRVLYRIGCVRRLAFACGYRVVILGQHKKWKRKSGRHLIHCCFQRTAAPFVSEKTFNALMHEVGQ